MRKDKLVAGHIYHIYNRGVEKRPLFLEDNDYKRFVNNLAVFNDLNPVLNYGRRCNCGNQTALSDKNNKIKNFVDILAFCLMPNHYHLLLRQKIENGITEFMRKLGTGYVNYFNLKYERVGTLFQGKFKSALINDESYFANIAYYIHSNPVDLIFPSWRKKGINETKRAVDFVDSYIWSSHLDYNGEPNFPSVVKKDFLEEYFGGPDNYKKYFKEFLGDFDALNFSDYLLD
jgi:putative transposase